MFKKWRKQWNCDHDYEYLCTMKNGYGERYVVLWCPNCDKETWMEHTKYTIAKMKGKI